MANIGIPEAPVPDWYKQNMGAGIVGMNQAYDTVYRDDARNLGMILSQLEAAKADQAIRKGDIELRYQDDLAKAELMSKQGLAEVNRLAGSQAMQQNNPAMLELFKNKAQTGMEQDIIANQDKIRESTINQMDLFIAAGGNPFMAAQLGVDPKIIPKFKEQWDAGTFKDLHEQIKTSRTDSVKHRQDLEVEAKKRENELEKARIAANATIGAAQIGADKMYAMNIRQDLTAEAANLRNIQDLMNKANKALSTQVLMAKGTKEYAAAKDKEAFVKDYVSKTPAGMELAQLTKDYINSKARMESIQKELRTGKPDVSLEKPAPVLPAGVTIKGEPSVKTNTTPPVSIQPQPAPVVKPSAPQQNPSLKFGYEQQRNIRPQDRFNPNSIGLMTATPNLPPVAQPQPILQNFNQRPPRQVSEVLSELLDRIRSGTASESEIKLIQSLSQSKPNQIGFGSLQQQLQGR